MTVGCVVFVITYFQSYTSVLCNFLGLQNCLSNDVCNSWHNPILYVSQLSVIGCFQVLHNVPTQTYIVLCYFETGFIYKYIDPKKDQKIKHFVYRLFYQQKYLCQQLAWHIWRIYCINCFRFRALMKWFKCLNSTKITTINHVNTACKRNFPCSFLPCKASDRLICKPLALSACKHKTYTLE